VLFKCSVVNMEILLLSFLGVAVTSSFFDGDDDSPTPEMVYGFEYQKDPKTWVPQFLNNTKHTCILELVPEGETIDAWQEMVSQQITFAKTPFSMQVDFWKKALLCADPAVELREETQSDGSILVTYTSHAAQEFSMRRFFEAKDGVYMIAYHVRPTLKDEARVKLWREIIEGAVLLPNPELM
jgi:hypothetical protein